MSLRTRLILTFVFLILVIMTIVAMSLAVILRGYQRDIQLARLADAVVPIAFQARAMFANNVPVKEMITRLDQQATGVGNTLILNDKGLVLAADPTSGLANRNLGVLQFVRANAQQSGFVWGTFQQKVLSRTMLFVAVVSGQYNGQPVYVGLTAREEPFFAVLDELGASLLVAGSITLVVSLLAAFLLARSIARPITRLTQATEAIARGQYDHRVPAEGNDEIKRLAASFNTMATQVQHSRQMEKDFVANVSHELKTPLTSIQGFAQAILDGAVQDVAGARRAAQTIFDEAARMSHLVGDLLMLARLESGQIPMARDVVNLGEFLSQWIERYRVRAENAGETLTAKVDTLPPIIGDANRLEQVFANLVENAIKYNRPGGSVTFAASVEPNASVGKSALRKITDSSAWIRVAVTDTGEGISAEDLPRVFDRFYRGDKARVAGGTGLGLSIAHEIVSAHGGTIKVESELGRGSTFSVRLPVK